MCYCHALDISKLPIYFGKVILFLTCLEGRKEEREEGRRGREEGEEGRKERKGGRRKRGREVRREEGREERRKEDREKGRKIYLRSGGRAWWLTPNPSTLGGQGRWIT